VYCEQARAMKILYLITGLNLGGAETQLVHVATRLKARGWEARVVSLIPSLSSAYAEDLETAGVPVVSLRMRHKLPDPRPLLQLAQIIRTWQPHVVHSHMVHANLLARLVRPFARVPVLVCTAHSVNEGGRLREILYRLTDPLCDLTTQVSRAGLERYVRVRAVPAHKIRFVPNGVDTVRFCPDREARGKMRDALGLQHSFVWLAVGRFERAKDYPTMLRAFSGVAARRPETCLLIAGQGTLRGEAEQLVAQLRIADRVRFLGVRKDIPALMNVADAFVMSSAWEGMPVVLLEAGATGLPVVATSVGGIPEVVDDGKNGFLVSPQDHTGLAHAMLRLMDMPPPELRRMAKAAQDLIGAHYSLQGAVAEWESVYRGLLQRDISVASRATLV